MHPRLLLLYAVLFLAGLALAAPVRAQESLYTVSGVHVDASAPSPTEALNAAIAQGRFKAFQTLYRRLARQADWTRQPQMDAQALLRLSRGYTIANERRSTTRYVADVTYMFNPDAVVRLLRTANIAYAQAQAKRILVIPMSPDVSHGPWSAALMAPAFQTSLVPFAVSGSEDDAALARLNFEAATWNDLAALATKYRVTEIALVQALYANGRMTVNIRRLGAGETPTKSTVEVPVLQTVSTTYPVAAQAAVRAIEDLWKTRAAIDFSQRGRLVADVRIANLAQWGEIQSQLATIGNVTGVTVTAMDMGYARIQLAYQGGADQLREALAAAGLTLTSRGGGQWMLASTK
jgi:hypothetical protein